MLNFIYRNPVKIVFGKETIKELDTLVPRKACVMLLYGGGSIRQNGVHARVIEALGTKRKIIEFGGIEANPTYETCMKAADIAYNQDVGFILAVGGGSVLDAAKFIAAAALYPGNEPWDILEKGATVESAIPLGSVLTLPATGSEMNANSVISHAERKLKLYFTSPLVYPVFSILDPETTFSLPPRQTTNGIVDTFVHVMEQYMTYDVQSPLQNRQAEAILATLTEEGPNVLSKPNDYDARANLMWCATQALNGTLCCGVVEDWSTHMVGHELTALYGIDHAVSLAIVMPSLWRNRFEGKKNRLAHYGKRVFGLSGTDETAIAEQAIAKTEEFFHSIGMKTRLADYGIEAEEAASAVSARFRERGTVLGERQDITPDEVQKIVAAC